MNPATQSENAIGKAKVSSMIPMLKQIANEWKLKMAFAGEHQSGNKPEVSDVAPSLIHVAFPKSTTKFVCSANDFKVALRLLKNSVKKN